MFDLDSTVTVTHSCEDKNTIYITFPDNLRLVVRNGEYVGWYICGEV